MTQGDAPRRHRRRRSLRRTVVIVVAAVLLAGGGVGAARAYARSLNHNLARTNAFAGLS